MDLQKLYSYMRKAINDYHMIETNDRIAIGLSGGKDSLTLLYGLSGLRKFYPKSFDIVAINVNLGYPGYDTTQMQALCEALNVEYYEIETKIADMLKANECSKCARLRKGAFNAKALELSCNKFAYGHNKDDVVETMLLSLIYEGRFSSFEPTTKYEDIGLTLIRPMIYVPKEDIVGFSNKYNLPVTKNPCPYDHATERTYVRTLLHDINQHTHGVRDRMMTAILNSELPPWKKKL